MDVELETKHARIYSSHMVMVLEGGLPQIFGFFDISVAVGEWVHVNLWNSQMDRSNLLSK